jgi:hypothetical protein
MTSVYMPGDDLPDSQWQWYTVPRPLPRPAPTVIEEPPPTVDVCMMRGTREHARECLTFPPGATVGQVPCLECGGTGYWGYGPVLETCGPCIDCKGTGRVWVGLA